MLLLSAAVLVADQAAKAALAATLRPGQEVVLVPGLLSLTHHRNPGLAFGVLSGAPLPAQRAVLVTVQVALVVGLLVYLRRLAPAATGARVAVACIVGGALGNLVDRVRLGSVVDFVHLSWRGYGWPDFNVADAAITVGVALLLLVPAPEEPTVS